MNSWAPFIHHGALCGRFERLPDPPQVKPFFQAQVICFERIPCHLQGIEVDEFMRVGVQVGLAFFRAIAACPFDVVAVLDFAPFLLVRCTQTPLEGIEV